MSAYWYPLETRQSFCFSYPWLLILAFFTYWGRLSTNFTCHFGCQRVILAGRVLVGLGVSKLLSRHLYLRLANDACLVCNTFSSTRPGLTVLVSSGLCCEELLQLGYH